VLSEVGLSASGPTFFLGVTDTKGYFIDKLFFPYDLKSNGVINIYNSLRVILRTSLRYTFQLNLLLGV
jgi:hypothetical protein